MKLSIFIPTYNRAAILERLLSALVFAIRGDVSLREEIEIVVSDNASPDGTEFVVRRMQDLAGADAHLEYTCNEQNIGALPNIIQAPQRCRGKYIWLLGDDDLVLPHVFPLILSEISVRDPEVIFLETSMDRKAGESGFCQLSKEQFFLTYAIASIAHISRLVLRADFFQAAQESLNARPAYFIWPMAMPLAELPPAAMISVLRDAAIYPTKDGGMHIWAFKTALARLAEFVTYCVRVAQSPDDLDKLFKLNFPSRKFVTKKYLAASLLFPAESEAFTTLKPLLEKFSLLSHPAIILGNFLRTPAAEPLRRLLRRFLKIPTME